VAGIKTRTNLKKQAVEALFHTRLFNWYNVAQKSMEDQRYSVERVLFVSDMLRRLLAIELNEILGNLCGITLYQLRTPGRQEIIVGSIRSSWNHPAKQES
jgi:hypothetical protein